MAAAAGRRGRWQRLKDLVFGGDDDRNLVDLFDASWSGRSGRSGNRSQTGEQQPGRSPRVGHAGTRGGARQVHSGSQRSDLGPSASLTPDGSGIGRDGSPQDPSSAAASQQQQQALSAASPALLPPPPPPSMPLLPGATAAGSAATASTAGAAHPADVRASSLPRPLSNAQQQPQAVAGSGPGAPVSPDPAAPTPVLRRVSSTPTGVCALPANSSAQSSAASLHKSFSASAVDEAATAAGSAEGSTDAASEAASRNAFSSHSSLLGGRSSGTSSKEGSGRGRPVRPSATSDAGSSDGSLGAGARGSKQVQASKAARRTRSPVPSMRWQPACGPAGTVCAPGITHSKPPQMQVAAPPSAATTMMLCQLSSTTAQAPAQHCKQQQQAQQQPFSLACFQSIKAVPTPAAPAPPSDSPSHAGGTAAGAPAAAAAAGSATVSLLSLQLRSSAASSAAPSREASVRGVASREQSYRGGGGPSREQSYRGGARPAMGGLSLALSRENSTRGGAPLSRESSMRPGTGGNGSQHGGVDLSAFGRAPATLSARAVPGSLAGALSAVPNRRLSEENPLSAAVRIQQELAGCGSGDWMGLPPVSEAVAPSGALSQAATAMDPFAPLSQVSVPPVVAGLQEQEELEEQEEEEAIAQAPCKPQQVGSWAKRMTKFEHSRGGSERLQEPTTKGGKAPGGLDPLLLTAALEALVAGPAGSACGAAPACNVLVGDPDLAVTSGLPAQHEVPAQQPSPSARLQGQGHSQGASGGASLPAVPFAPSGGSGSGPLTAGDVQATMLSSSWDTAAAAVLPPVVQVGGSAPTRGFSPPNSTQGSADGLRASSQPLPSELAAASKEWNRSFMRRWRAVKKRAYLQALGLRALWRVNSLSDRHEPLELLTNDLPQYDNGMRRAWSVTRLAAQEEALRQDGRHGGCIRPAVSDARPALRRPSNSAGMHKDPSLAALLLGEVAEVC